MTACTPKFGTRKFAIRFDPVRSGKTFGEYLHLISNVRELKNNLILKSIQRTTAVNFARSGNTAAKQLYGSLLGTAQARATFLDSEPKLKYSPQTSHENTQEFKERIYRNCFFEIYDLIRNKWLRNGWMVQICEYFLEHTSDTFLKFLANKLPPAEKRAILGNLKDRYSGKTMAFSTTYLDNVLGELRKRMVENEEVTDYIWKGIQSYGDDNTHLSRLRILTRNGWERTRNGKKVPISFEDLLPYLFGSYKRQSRREINQWMKKYADDPDRLWKALGSYFPNLKERPPGEVFEVLNAELAKVDPNTISLQTCIQVGIQEELASMSRETCVQQLLKPRFERIKIQSINPSGFLTFIMTKVRYTVRNLLTDRGECSIYASCNGEGEIYARSNRFQPILQDTLTGFAGKIDPPIVRSKTIGIKFSEQIYKTPVTDSPSSPLSIHLTPYSKDKGFFFAVSQKTIDRLRAFAGESVPVERLFKTPPVIQTEGRKVIINQPLPMGQESQEQRYVSPRSQRKGKRIVLGVDLGLIHFAVVSVFEQDISTGVKREIARYFIDQQQLIGSKFNGSTKRFERLQKKCNIKRRLRHLNGEKRKLQYLKSVLENDGGWKRTIKYYHLCKRLDYVWGARKKKHDAITQKLAHVLIQMGQVFDVTCIAFEDLRWVQHSKKRQVGEWLARNQITFFHSQIIARTQFLGVQQGVAVKIVNAKWTSKIFWKAQLEQDLRISWNTPRESIEDYIGVRDGKQFRYLEGESLMWQGDSDLNAARNVALRGLLAVT